MTPTLYGIPNCDTVRRARAFLESRGVAYDFHDYKKVGADAERLNRWVDALGWEAILNRSGTTFRKLPDSDRADLDREKATALMLSAPSMIKRPVVEGAGSLIVGFVPDRWGETFG